MNPFELRSSMIFHCSRHGGVCHALKGWQRAFFTRQTGFFLFWLLTCCLLIPVTRAQASAPTTHSLARWEFRELHMGVAVRLAVYARDEEQARRACRAAFDRVAQIDTIASDWRVDSELNRVVAHFAQRDESVTISPELFAMLARAREVARATKGLFDPTIAPLVALWRTSRRLGTLPSAQEIAKAKALVSWKRMRLDAKKRTVHLGRGQKLDLGGVAKGFACDHSLQVLGEHGIERALVEAGGDIAVSSAPPGQAGWKIELWNGRPLWLANAALSTSGDAVQWVEIGGARYSHIVDVRTGLGMTQASTAIVISRHAFLTDALSTAAILLGPRDSRKLFDKFDAWHMNVVLAR
jgi:thiamine biosynthesis lipoprotein